MVHRNDERPGATPQMDFLRSRHKQKKSVIRKPGNGFLSKCLSNNLSHYQASSRYQGYNDPYYAYNNGYDTCNGLKSHVK
jgi:hypothetical protein